MESTETVTEPTYRWDLIRDIDLHVGPKTRVGIAIPENGRGAWLKLEEGRATVNVWSALDVRDADSDIDTLIEFFGRCYWQLVHTKEGRREDANLTAFVRDLVSDPEDIHESDLVPGEVVLPDDPTSDTPTHIEPEVES